MEEEVGADEVAVSAAMVVVVVVLVVVAVLSSVVVLVVGVEVCVAPGSGGSAAVDADLISLPGVWETTKAWWGWWCKTAGEELGIGC